MDEIMVSIVCMTYNHEKYIRDAIDGFLNQRIDFKYEIIIHDDASTDLTAAIIREYEKKYPDVIHGVYQNVNQYSIKGALLLRDMYQKCRGKYIAICEGDDYWIDCNKLHLQVDYMERHKDCMLLMHDGVRINYKEGTVEAICPFDLEKDLTAEELIIQRSIPTASYMCRCNVAQIDRFFFECGVGDYPTQLYCLTKGKVHYLNRIMSVYRYMHQGSWTEGYEISFENAIRHYIRMWDFLRKFNEYTSGKYSKYIVSKVQSYLSGALGLISRREKNNLLRFYNLCRDEKSNLEYYYEMKRICAQTYDEEYLDENISAMAMRYKHIVIMGAGKYGAMVAKQMTSHGIEFEGFVISQKECESQYFMGKPKWSLDTVPFKNDLGIIIAINPVVWHEIADALRMYQIRDWYCPYLMRIFQEYE